MKKTVDVFKCMLVKETEIRYEAVGSPEDAATLFRAFGLADAAEEHFVMACLASDGSVTAMSEVSHGTLDSSLVSPREVYKRAVLCNASRIILAHNHPSGSLKPSAADIAVTRQLSESGELLGIPVVDHLILTLNGQYSFKQAGLL